MVSDRLFGSRSRVMSLQWAGVVLSMVVASSTWSVEPAPLEFHPDGTFKIVQFTDTHFGSSPSNELIAEVTNTMRVVLEAELPDLVILTGDNVTTRTQPKEAWQGLVKPMTDRKIRWAAVMGNHDFENTGMPQAQIESFLQTLPYSLCQPGPEETGAGGNYVLPVAGHGKTQAALYCMDSGDYADPKLSKGYAWFRFGQIQWFREQSRALAAANGGAPLPSLAFFHIPFPEYAQAQSAAWAVGHKDEKISSPLMNSGMFTAMLESGAVLGTFVGHDHNNDFASPYCGICLAFGRKTGPLSYHHLPAGGARVIVMQEGGRRFVTWIRTASGEVESKVGFPDGFVAR